jgi:hypothetical protein
VIALRHQLALCFLIGAMSIPTTNAGASGRARIQQPDGVVKVYDGVHIRVQDHQRLLITSSDGKGTLVINKASCTAIADLLRCLPYSAELDQNGRVLPIAVQTGTVWLNMSSATHQLPFSSTQLATRGVLMALATKRGTHVSLTGTVDEVTK